jgi:rhodanese-related sulfurtransferase
MPRPLAALRPPADAGSAAPRSSAGPWDADIGGAAQLLRANPDIIALDVRTPSEYAAGRVADGVNIDFFGDDFEGKLASLDRSATYLVYCRSGGRSGMTLALMEQLGFRFVVHMPAGFDGWARSGQPVRTDKAT